MLRLIQKLNEGSLLRRTLLHMAVFAAGSVSFLALVSVLVVSSAKALLPSPHDTTEASAGAANEDADEAQDADASSPQAAAESAGVNDGPKTVAQVRTAKRREGALIR